eukprot:scaffold71236_cov69-Phaeocystis_antarctica.AAC.3
MHERPLHRRWTLRWFLEGVPPFSLHGLRLTLGLNKFLLETLARRAGVRQARVRSSLLVHLRYYASFDNEAIDAGRKDSSALCGRRALRIRRLLGPQQHRLGGLVEPVVLQAEREERAIGLDRACQCLHSLALERAVSTQLEALQAGVAPQHRRQALHPLAPHKVLAQVEVAQRRLWRGAQRLGHGHGACPGDPAPGEIEALQRLAGCEQLGERGASDRAEGVPRDVELAQGAIRSERRSRRDARRRAHGVGGHV